MLFDRSRRRALGGLARRAGLWLAVAATAVSTPALLSGCGGGADRTKAQVRLVNATLDYGALELRVEGNVRQGGVGYGSAAGYVEVDPGRLNSITQGGSPTELLSFTPSQRERRYYSVLVYGRQGALRQLQLDDNQGQPEDNRTLLRVINAAPDAGSLDVYLTGANDPLASAVPVQAGAAYGTLGEARTLLSSTVRLRVTGANDTEDLRLDVGGLVLGNRQVATLVITPGRGGVLVNALLLVQQGAINAAANTQARLRVVAGVAGGGAVGVRVGDTTLLTSQVSPAVTTYRLLAAGQAPAVVSVNGAALASRPLALEAGEDYTLMVHGSPAQPRFDLLPDDNRAAANAGQARLRLLNGVADAGGPLSMTLDFAPAADNVAVGAASAYRSFSATLTGQLAVAAAGGGGPLFSAREQVLAAGGVYSVIMVGSTSAPVGIVRRDR